MYTVTHAWGILFQKLIKKYWEKNFSQGNTMESKVIQSVSIFKKILTTILTSLLDHHYLEKWPSLQSLTKLQKPWFNKPPFAVDEVNQIYIQIYPPNAEQIDSIWNCMHELNICYFYIIHLYLFLSLLYIYVILFVHQPETSQNWGNLQKFALWGQCKDCFDWHKWYLYQYSEKLTFFEIS